MSSKKNNKFQYDLNKGATCEEHAYNCRVQLQAIEQAINSVLLGKEITINVGGVDQRIQREDLDALRRAKTYYTDLLNSYEDNPAIEGIEVVL